MPTKPKKPEIMAPAGNETSLRAALQGGADAIYFGLNVFSMRARAKSFTTRSLPKIMRICKEHGARAYLTLNTIIYENELARLDAVLAAAKKAGVDAVIAWDFAVCERVKNAGIPLYLSTQFSLSNSDAVQQAVRMTGAERIVLAREVTLGDVKKIRRALDKAGMKHVEIETFVHGAMCVSVSGRCYMAEHLEGQSANRGACTQPCRREYEIADPKGKASFRMGENYLLSPKDLCALPFLEKLIEAGIASFKIEGRSRSPEYVLTVTKAYRDTIDFYFANKGKKGWRDAFEGQKAKAYSEVEKVYNRGFSEGFFMGQPIGQWTTAHGNVAKERKVLAGKVVNYFRNKKIAHIQLQGADLQSGDRMQIHGTTTGVVELSCPELMRIDDQEVSHAKAGSSLTMRIEQPVRRNDRVFIIQG